MLQKFLAIIKNLHKVLWGIGLFLLVTSCETFDDLLIKNTYVHYYPEKRAAKKVPIFIKTSYDKEKELFNSYAVIGKSTFTNRPVTAEACIKFGKQVGADMVLLSFGNKQEVTKYVRIAVPDKEISTSTAESTNTLGALSDTLWDHLLDSKRKRITITPKNKEQHQTIYKYINQPYIEIHYDQTVLFLKKTNHLKAPWEYSLKDFISQQNSDASPYVGDWVNYQTGKLTLFATESEYVAFISRDKKYRNKEKRVINKRLKWKNGDIKLRINKNNKQGWYLNSDKIPVCVYIQLNQTHHLEIIDQQTGRLIISLNKT
ncbi:hypothetical protein [Candidatus Cardinium hertigii]|jgi:hypothetical protein|uniref:Uncharacterized protein n=1 Tax=Candidatus Cardinium hertigii TaxID=247481 RepID=A0A3N2QBJ0_9BACT|nr:hypothetical protein [Candidatus Cardinium hertigii]ROT47009.1 hypothetical protein EDM02_05590 [Candidatus Cardinium hertigii]